MKRSIFLSLLLGLLGLVIAWDIHRGQWSDIIMGGVIFAVTFAAYMVGAAMEARKH